jgi:hypothetical protein
MEHIASDREAFASLTRAMKPGGHLVVGSPSSQQPLHLRLVTWRERRVGFDPSEYGHVRQGYSIQELRQRFEAPGSKPMRIRYTYGRWGTVSFDLFFSIGDNRPNPLLFLGLYPLLKLLGWLDLKNQPAHGAAVLGVAQKLTNGQE